MWSSYEEFIDGENIETDADILVSRSTDDGASWSAPHTLNTNAEFDFGDDLAPQITTDALGNWVAVWHSHESNIGTGIGNDKDILVSRSTDGGVNWSDPEALNTNAVPDGGHDWDPQLTTNGLGNWVAVWHSYEPFIDGENIGTNADILVSRSMDAGVNWSDPQALNTNATIDGGFDFKPQLTTDSSGTWVAVWYSSEFNIGLGIDSDYDILVSRSTDGGVNWSDPEAINTNAGIDDGADYEPQLTTDGLGTWIAVWHSGESDIGGESIETDWDILVSRSTYGAQNWSDPQALNTNAEDDLGDDWDPQLTTDALGTWIAVWRSNNSDIGDGNGTGTDYDILFSRWTDTDRDNISDSDETDLYSTNPSKLDSDKDGVNDYDEIFLHNTDPLDQDSDDDGLLDGEEVAIGSNPNIFNILGTVGAINDMSTRTFTVTVPAYPTPQQIDDINVYINIQHTYDDDLQITLTSPEGTKVTLIANEGSNGDDFGNTWLDDEALSSILQGSAPFNGSYRPEKTVATFDGESPVGTWTLTITDDAPGDSGSLINWLLEITTGDPTADFTSLWVDFNAVTNGIGAKAFPYKTLFN